MIHVKQRQLKTLNFSQSLPNNSPQSEIAATATNILFHDPTAECTIRMVLQNYPRTMFVFVLQA